MTLQVQTLTLLALMASGMLLGAVYDSYSVILREWRFLRFLGPVIDVGFWIGALIFVFSLLLRINNADFRISIYLLLFLGLGVYRLTLRQAVIQSTVGIVVAITWFVQTVIRIVQMVIIQPVLWLLQILYRILLAFDRLLQAIERFLLWPVELILKAIWVSLRWLLSPLIRPLWKWILPYYRQAGNYWRISQHRWKELKMLVSNWIIRKDDDDTKPPL